MPINATVPSLVKISLHTTGIYKKKIIVFGARCEVEEGGESKLE